MATFADLPTELRERVCCEVLACPGEMRLRTYAALLGVPKSEADPGSFVKEWADEFNCQFTTLMDVVRNNVRHGIDSDICRLAVATRDTPSAVTTDMAALNGYVQAYANSFKDLYSDGYWDRKNSPTPRKWAWLQAVVRALPTTYKGAAVAEAWLARLFPVSEEHLVHKENFRPHVGKQGLTAEIARRCLACVAVSTRVHPETIMRIVRFVRMERYYTVDDLENTVPIYTVPAASVFLLMANSPDEYTAISFVAALVSGRRVACYSENSVFSAADVCNSVAAVLSRTSRDGISKEEVGQWALACVAVAIPNFCTQKMDDHTVLRDSVRRLLLGVGLHWRQTIADAVLSTFMKDEMRMYGRHEMNYGVFPGDLMQVHNALSDTNCHIPYWLEKVASRYNWRNFDPSTNIYIDRLKMCQVTGNASATAFNAVIYYALTEAPVDVIESLYAYCEQKVGLFIMAEVFMRVEGKECTNENVLGLFWKDGRLDVGRLTRLMNQMETKGPREGFWPDEHTARPFWNGLADKLARGYPENTQTLELLYKSGGSSFLANMVAQRVSEQRWPDL
jgi:hypothetical protein